MEVWYMVYMPHIQIRYLNLTRKTGAQGSARGKIKKRNHSGHLSKWPFITPVPGELPAFSQGKDQDWSPCCSFSPKDFTSFPCFSHSSHTTYETGKGSLAGWELRAPQQRSEGGKLFSCQQGKALPSPPPWARWKQGSAHLECLQAQSRKWISVAKLLLANTSSTQLSPGFCMRIVHKATLASANDIHHQFFPKRDHLPRNGSWTVPFSQEVSVVTAAGAGWLCHTLSFLTLYLSNKLSSWKTETPSES